MLFTEGGEEDMDRDDLYEPIYQWFRYGDPLQWIQLRELLDDLVDAVLDDIKWNGL